MSKELTTYRKSAPGFSQTLFAGKGFALIHATAPPGEAARDTRFPGYVFTITLNDIGVMDWDTGSGRRRRGAVGKEDCFLWQAQQPLYYCMENPLECLMLHLDPDFLETVACESTGKAGAVELVDQSIIRDPLISSIGDTLLRFHAANGSIDQIYGETLAAALAVHTLRNYARQPPAALPFSPAGLPREELRRATDFIHDNLGGRLTLAAVAGEVGYSPFHFHRLFRAAVGKPLHRYVMEARVERACALIQHGSLPLAAIAAEVGFANQGHFSQQFKAIHGLPPLPFRSARIYKKKRKFLEASFIPLP